MNEYLTERLLGILLRDLYPNQEFIHDRMVPNSGIRARPDYRCDELMLIVEFDGDQHYRSSKKIKSEEVKNGTYTNMGYKVVRFPYFIQPSRNIINLLLNLNVDYEQTYPHGFIDEAAILPADFCEIGVLKFINDLNRFNIIRAEIIESLRNKVETHGDIDLVLPPTLNNLID